MSVDLDVVVDVHPDLFPFGVDISLVRQRLQGGLVAGLEEGAPGAWELVEGALIETLEQLADSDIELGE